MGLVNKQRLFPQTWDLKKTKDLAQTSVKFCCWVLSLHPEQPQGACRCCCSKLPTWWLASDRDRTKERQVRRVGAECWPQIWHRWPVSFFLWRLPRSGKWSGLGWHPQPVTDLPRIHSKKYLYWESSECGTFAQLTVNQEFHLLSFFTFPFISLSSLSHPSEFSTF